MTSQGTLVFLCMVSIVSYTIIKRYGIGFSLAILLLVSFILNTNNEYALTSDVIMTHFIVLGGYVFFRSSFRFSSLRLPRFHFSFSWFGFGIPQLLKKTWQQYQIRQEQAQNRARSQREQRENAKTQKQKSNSEDEERKRQADEYYRRQREEEKKREYEARDVRNHEQVLGVRAGHTYEELRQAYKTQCQRLHPDKWQDRPEAFRLAMEKELKLVNKAYETLSKKFRR